MNKDGKLRTWGDEEFAKKLVEFAHIEVDDSPTRWRRSSPNWRAVRPAALRLLGHRAAEDYSPDVTGKVATGSSAAGASEKAVLHLVVARIAAPRGRLDDVDGTVRAGPARRRPLSRRELGADPAAGAELQQQGTGPIPENMNAATPLDQSDIDQLNLDYQGRAGSMMAVDDHVADMIRTLRETHQLKNTVIMFVSDNGWLQGQHRIPGDKFLPYDESLKVPLIVRGPDIPQGEKVKGQVSNIDFAPTLLDFANVRAGRTMDGLSLLPTIAEPDRVPQPGARGGGAGAAVRRGDPGQRLGPALRGSADRPLDVRRVHRERRPTALRSSERSVRAPQPRRRSGLRRRRGTAGREGDRALDLRRQGVLEDQAVGPKAPSAAAPVSAPGRIRTCDLRLRRAALYPAELRARVNRSLFRLSPGGGRRRA